MFRRYRAGYIALFAIYFGTLTYAVLVSDKTYVDFIDIWFGKSVFILVAPVFLLSGLLTYQMMRRKLPRPLKTLYRFFRRERGWLGRGLLLTLMIFPLSTAFTAIKTNIPVLQPFYADAYFIAADRMIFGTDPWRITHGILGYLPTIIIDRAYLLWLTAQLVLVVSLYFTRNQILQLKGLIAYQASWILLGGVMATALASVGPCFYGEYFGSDYFDPLMSKLESYDNLSALFFQEKLLESRGKDVFGAGISAMPSMHVGIALLIVLLVKDRWGMGRGWAMAIIFFILTAIGSVHLGWHYAVDGLVSIVGVWIIWRLTSAFVDRVVAKEAARDRIVSTPPEFLPA